MDENQRCGEFTPAAAAARPVRRHAPSLTRSRGVVVVPKPGTIKRTVLDHIAECGSRGATTDEVQVGLDSTHQTISSTVNGLMNDGLIVDSGQRRATRTGSQATVWIDAKLARALEAASRPQPALFEDDDAPAATPKPRPAYVVYGDRDVSVTCGKVTLTVPRDVDEQAILDTNGQEVRFWPREHRGKLVARIESPFATDAELTTLVGSMLESLRSGLQDALALVRAA